MQLRFSFFSFPLLFIILFFSSCKQDGKEATIAQTQYTLLSAAAFKIKSATMPEAVILDLRKPTEVAEGKISGAVVKNYFDADFVNFLKTLDKSKPLFIYSQNGEISSKVAAIMGKQGFSEILDLQGGYNAWTQLRH